MKRLVSVLLVLLLWVCWSRAHDLFLKRDSFFLKPNRAVSISLLNGTFEKSENVITRDRMVDVSLVFPDGRRVHPDTSQWRDAGTVTVLDFETGAPGTYVVGVSTAPRTIALSARDFNNYLEHDGVLDVLEARKRHNELDKDARERYAKHVKAILQVGEKRTETYATVLGYPVEFVPLSNPYALHEGDTLKVRMLRAGRPVANHLVYASHAGFHGHGDEGGHREAVQTRTDADGLVRIPLRAVGLWYVRAIYMERVSQPNADYESNWATLTFEVR